MNRINGTMMAAMLLLGGLGMAQASDKASDKASGDEADKHAVAALDTEYQAAVKRNDEKTMARILHDRFVLTLGDGRTFTRADLLNGARNRDIEYEQQDEDEGTQVVRVWGDTAVVTARLWIKGKGRDGKEFDRRLWFSDTYVRTPQGWRYAFGQASLRLPPEPASGGGGGGGEKSSRRGDVTFM